MKTIIMAGGRGTRMASFAPDLPKPMISICGKPILQHQIECLVKNDLKDILIVVGHLGHVIKDYFSDGSRFGCSISYFEETTPLGSGGALFKIINDLDDVFLLISGDVIFDIDFPRMTEFFRSRKAWAVLVAHPNSHPYDSALLFTDESQRVINWLNKEEPRNFYKNLVNAGIQMLSRELLLLVKPASEKVDLDREILKPAVNSGKIFAYPTPEYIKDAGTPDRFNQVSLDIQSGLVRKRGLSRKQKAVFIDRDGTINKTICFLNRHEDFELLPNVSEAISRINGSGYLAIVITNQPVIARGDCTIEELDLIHKKMETLLGKDGAYIDDLFYCPHHPDRGFAGERPEYKIACDCRKPKPGMIFEAAKKYNIDLSVSFMVGDSMNDVKAGIAAGCTPVLLGGNKPEEKLRVDGKIVAQFQNLCEFVKACL